MAMISGVSGMVVRSNSPDANDQNKLSGFVGAAFRIFVPTAAYFNSILYVALKPNPAFVS
jgi:hypothetical protein